MRSRIGLIATSDTLAIAAVAVPLVWVPPLWGVFALRALHKRAPLSRGVR